MAPPIARRTVLTDRLSIGLLVLTAVSGTVDAVSYLGLGHVFTANMTGNVVFLAFAAAGAPNISIGHSIHVRDLALPRGVELALRGDENPTVASAQIPKTAIAEEEAAAAAAAAGAVEGVVAPAEAVPAAADVPTVKQKAPEAAAPASDEKAGKGGKAEKAEKK